jgi:peptidoglycan hydrolase-like protein with peptidoglycan-binding domain
VRGGCEIFRAMRRLVLLTLLTAATVLVAPNPALATGSPKLAALQAALWQRGLYHGNLSGIMNRATVRGVKRLQRSAGLAVDGIVGPKTRPLLGRLGAPALGSRTLRRGRVGGDVVELQFLLAEHGFPSARFDGVMGGHVVAALRRFQRYAGLKVDGRSGQSTLHALAQPPPQAPTGVLAWPLEAPISSAFGPRRNCFHAGIDLAVASGTSVRAAAAGSVVFAGPGGNFGLLVVIAHSGKLRSYYAHLSRVDVTYGQKLNVGARIGLSGKSGQATGPNLHFELRLRGAAVDPLPALR